MLAVSAHRGHHGLVPLPRRLVAGALLLGVTMAGCGGSSGPDAEPSSSTSPSGVTTECSDRPDQTPVPVVVIDQPILAGTTGAEAAEAGALVETTIAWGFRPATAVVSLDDIASAAAVQDLTPGQMATINQFGLPPDNTVPVSPVVMCNR